MDLMIRRAVPSDAATIVEWNRRMAMETENKSLDPEILTRGVEAVFQDQLKGFYLVAVVEEQVIGQLMVTLEWSDWRNGWFWWIQSVYVRTDYRQKGVFRQLWDQVVLEGKQQGDVIGIRLYVERENQVAQKVYAQLGMSDAGYFVYEWLQE